MTGDEKSMLNPCDTLVLIVTVVIFSPHKYPIL